MYSAQPRLNAIKKYLYEILIFPVFYHNLQNFLHRFFCKGLRYNILLVITHKTELYMIYEK